MAASLVAAPDSAAQTAPATEDTVSMQSAVDAYQRRNFKLARERFEFLAKQGNARAQTALGIMYSFGEGIPQDNARAVEYYRAAANQDYAPAQYNLALMYLGGGPLPRNKARAVELLRQAALSGHPGAEAKLRDIDNFAYAEVRQSARKRKSTPTRSTVQDPAFTKKLRVSTLRRSDLDLTYAETGRPRRPADPALQPARPAAASPTSPTLTSAAPSPIQTTEDQDSSQLSPPAAATAPSNEAPLAALGSEQPASVGSTSRESDENKSPAAQHTPVAATVAPNSVAFAAQPENAASEIVESKDARHLSVAAPVVSPVESDAVAADGSGSAPPSSNTLATATEDSQLVEAAVRAETPSDETVAAVREDIESAIDASEDATNVESTGEPESTDLTTAQPPSDPRPEDDREAEGAAPSSSAFSLSNVLALVLGTGEDDANAATADSQSAEPNPVDPASAVSASGSAGPAIASTSAPLETPDRILSTAPVAVPEAGLASAQPNAQPAAGNNEGSASNTETIGTRQSDPDTVESTVLEGKRAEPRTTAPADDTMTAAADPDLARGTDAPSILAQMPRPQPAAPVSAPLPAASAQHRPLATASTDIESIPETRQDARSSNAPEANAPQSAPADAVLANADTPSPAPEPSTPTTVHPPPSASVPTPAPSAKPALPAVAALPPANYTIQFAATRSAGAALAAWRRLLAKHDAVLSPYEPTFTAVELGGTRGTWFRLRIHGFADFNAANEVCDALREKAADVPCLVIQQR